MEKLKVIRAVSLVLIIIGIASFVSLYFVPQYFDEKDLVTGTRTLKEDSSVNLGNSSRTVFSLSEGQSIDIEVSNIYDANASETWTVYVIIARYAEYAEANLSTDAPTTLTELSHRRTEILYPDDSSSSTETTSTIAETETVIINFAGGISSGIPYTIPGKYVVVVYAIETSTTWEEANIKFGLEITLNGQSGTVRTALTWIGWITVLAGVIVGIAYIIMARKR